MRRKTTERAKSLRRCMSLPEVLLWQQLKGRKPSFRRQIPMEGFVLDFYCPAARLAIEVDGKQHELSGESGARRDGELRAAGITVRRVSAQAVLRDPEEVALVCLGHATELIEGRKEPY